MNPESRKKNPTNTNPTFTTGYSVTHGCAFHRRPAGVKWNSMMHTAASERMPVSAGSAGLRAIEAVSEDEGSAVKQSPGVEAAANPVQDARAVPEHAAAPS